MALATCEIYCTESGATYEVADGRVRRAGPRRPGLLTDWTPYAALNRLPATLVRPGAQGEVLEIVLTTGKRIITSRLVPPAAVSG